MYKFILLFLTSLTACSFGSIEHQGYPEVIKKYSWGELRVHFKGTQESQNINETIYKEPYTLIVWVMAEEKKSCKIRLNQLELKTASRGTQNIKSGIKKSFWSDPYNSQLTSFVFKDVVFKHEEIALKISGSSLYECTQIKFSESLKFKKTNTKENVGLWSQ